MWAMIPIPVSDPGRSVSAFLRAARAAAIGSCAGVDRHLDGNLPDCLPACLLARF